MIPISAISSLLSEYDEKDHSRLEMVRDLLKHKDGFDKTINGQEATLLLMYEYAVSVERVTNGRVSFETTINRIFSTLDKLRFGELKDGDEDILYGKSFDDQTMIQVKSEEFDRKVRKSTGAAHFMYFTQDGIFNSAIAIFGKKTLEGKDGTTSVTAGSDFTNLSDLRQVFFHELNHHFEVQFAKEKFENIPSEYDGIDGKHYINITQVTAYRYGTRDGVSDIVSLPPDKHFVMATGLVTKEQRGDKIIMHNQITEGMVELIAREQLKSIGVPESEIEDGRYFEQVEMMKRVVACRDKNKKSGRGKTFADFLTNATEIKAELETIVVHDNGVSKDGLHYIGDCADLAFAKETPKRRHLKRMKDFVIELGIDEQVVEELGQHRIWQVAEINDDLRKSFEQQLVEGNIDDAEKEERLKTIMSEYIRLLDEERMFFDGIPEKLGYVKSKQIDIARKEI